MHINYLGHSCFKIKGKRGTVVCDPYNDYVGFTMSTASADIVTISHDHQDHSDLSKIRGTARRDNPFVINAPGEYEVEGISVFGVPSFHDSSQGAERGENIIYTIFLDGMKVCHLGDLGHLLDDKMISEIGLVDILLVPVGGVFTINPEQAVKVTRSLEPSIVIPMHYKTSAHDEKVFGELATLKDFLQAYGAEVEPEEKLSIKKSQLPEEMELIVLKQT